MSRYPSPKGIRRLRSFPLLWWIKIDQLFFNCESKCFSTHHCWLHPCSGAIKKKHHNPVETKPSSSIYIHSDQFFRHRPRPRQQIATRTERGRFRGHRQLFIILIHLDFGPESFKGRGGGIGREDETERVPILDSSTPHLVWHHHHQRFGVTSKKNIPKRNSSVVIHEFMIYFTSMDDPSPLKILRSKLRACLQPTIKTHCGRVKWAIQRIATMARNGFRTPLFAGQ